MESVDALFLLCQQLKSEMTTIYHWRLYIIHLPDYLAD